MGFVQMQFGNGRRGHRSKKKVRSEHHRNPLGNEVSIVESIKCATNLILLLLINCWIDHDGIPVGCVVARPAFPSDPYDRKKTSSSLDMIEDQTNAVSSLERSAEETESRTTTTQNSAFSCSDTTSGRTE
jgi:hypothetical protein